MSDPTASGDTGAATDTSPEEALIEAAKEGDDLLEALPEDEVAAASTVAADAAAAERDSYRDSLQRLQADFENFRKRTQRQSDEQMQRAAEALVTKLLPVLDTIDLALAHDPNASLEQVKAALTETLTKEGLERLPGVGHAFDPTLHEAVAHEPSEEEPTVSEELRAGYRWKGRVVRPAMVKVSG